MNGFSRPLGRTAAILAILAVAALAPIATASAADPVFAPGPDGLITAVTGANHTDDVAAGDFNGDGNVDVAASFDMVTPPPAALLAYALGDGTGHLGSFGTGTVFESPPVLASADLNGDGVSDLVAGDPGSDFASVLLGGPGGLAASSSLAPGGGSRGVTIDDFNRDGKPDIALLVGGAPGSVAVFLGDGAGHFSAASGSPFASGGNDGSAPRFPERIVSGNFNPNTDQNPDVVVMNDQTPNVAILLGDGTGALGTATVLGTNGPAATNKAIAAGDVTVDGIPDLVSPTPTTLQTDAGDGTGAFAAPVAFAAPWSNSAAGIALGDLNGDGKPDAAVTSDHDGRVDVLKGTGTSPWFATSDSHLLAGTTEPANHAEIADMNGDGRPDLVVGLVFGQLEVLLSNTVIPLSITGPPSAVHDTSATVTGTVDPNGLPTTYGVELRPLGGATVTPISTGTLTGGANAVSASITGLSPSTAYQYRVTATNSNGTSRGLWRKFTTTITPPANTSPPQVSGAAVTGQTLSCTPGSWTGSPSFSYQWLRGGVAVAAGSTYPVTAADVGSALACLVTGTNAGGSTAATSPTLVATALLARPSATRAPRVVGRGVPGQLVACDAGAWTTGGSFAYAWLRDGRAIRHASAVLYKVSVLDGGHRLACRVTVTNGAGAGSADSRALRVKPTRCVVPKLAGLTTRAAKRALATFGCRAGRTRSTHSRRVRKGRVAGSVPRAGAVKPLRTRVLLLVSSGR